MEVAADPHPAHGRGAALLDMHVAPDAAAHQQHRPVAPVRTLPSTTTRRATRRAPRLTTMLPSTRVRVSTHRAPAGTFRLSTVVAPMLPRQTRSSAPAGPAAARAAPAAIAIAAAVRRRDAIDPLLRSPTAAGSQPRMRGP